MKSELTEALGIEFPLILGPMRLITLGSMAAAVSKCGGLGQIASSGLPLPQLRKEIAKARELTDKPIGVNIPLHRPNALEILQIASEMGVKVVTTGGGNPTGIMGPARNLGIKILHKVSTVETGLKAQEAGVFGIIGMGFEAGGHTGTSQVTTLCLIPSLTDKLDIPVIAAGGIVDHRGFLAALALGAAGVEVGTRFLASRECNIPLYYKEAILKASETGTVVVGDGVMRLRILRNRAAESMGKGNRDKNTEHRLLDYSEEEADMESVIMPAGQGAGLINSALSIREIISEFVDRSRDLSAEINHYLENNQ